MDVTVKHRTKQREKSNKNLKPFKPGQSGNPKGRPKKEFSIANILESMLNNPDPFDPEQKRTALEAICKKAIALAIGGDKDARNWVADRFEGKALERVLKQKSNDILEIK